MPVCLSFPGVAGCIAFEVGALRGLVEVLESEGKKAEAYAGLSSGSIIATLLALGCTPDEMEKHFHRFTLFFNRWHHHPITHWFSHLRSLWSEIMPPEAYKSLSGKLYIGYSAITPTGLRPRSVSSYSSNEEVVRAIEVSCHLMPYRWLPFQWYRGELACDGAFSSRLLRPEGYEVVGVTTSMVHAHVFWSDWLPTLELYKVARLQTNGYHFVQHHREYFQALIRGEKVALPILSRYFNPFRWLRRVWYVCCLLWLWLQWKRMTRQLTEMRCC